MVATDARLTETGLKRQIGRLRGFLSYADLKEELLRVLWKYASTDEHAERIVTEIIDARLPNDKGLTPCPTPGELIAHARTVPISKPATIRKASRGCVDCAGTGFARDFVLATRRGDRFDTEIVTEEQYEELRKKPLSESSQAVYIGVHRCHCVAPRSEGASL